MLSLFAKTYEYSNGNCFVDGVLQPTTEQCTNITNTFLNIGAALLVFFAILAVIWLVFFVFWIIQLVHVIKHEDIKDRNLWIILQIAAFFLGFIWLSVPIYYFVVMRKYKNQQPIEPIKQTPEPVEATTENTKENPKQ
jgi:hypothetical protein